MKGNHLETGSKRARYSIEILHLRYAVDAVDRGSIRQVAELHSVRHSSVSRAIRQLENFIGAVIFERSGSGVKPTQTGRNVLKISRLILSQVDVLAATATSERLGAAGRLSIGFCTSISAGNLRATFVDLKRRLPEIEIATVERSQKQLAMQLRGGVVDILILAGKITALGEKALPLWSERVFVAIPEGHHLASRDFAFWTDLYGETILLSSHDPGRDFEQLLMSKLSPQDLPKIERHDVSRGIIKSLVSIHMGVSLVIESDTGANFAGLTYRELRDGSGPSRMEFSAIWRPDNENPALASFLKLLGERYPLPP